MKHPNILSILFILSRFKKYLVKFMLQKASAWTMTSCKTLAKINNWSTGSDNNFFIHHHYFVFLMSKTDRKQRPELKASWCSGLVRWFNILTWSYVLRKPFLIFIFIYLHHKCHSFDSHITLMHQSICAAVLI